MEALVVTAGTARCALPMDRISEVRAYSPETPVPGVPPFMRGVVERNGAPVHVLDLAGRLFGTPSCIGARTCLVFFHHVARHGAAAVLVEDVERLAGDETAPGDETAAFDCVAGMLHDSVGSVALLDIDRLFEVGSRGVS